MGTLKLQKETVKEILEYTMYFDSPNMWKVLKRYFKSVLWVKEVHPARCKIFMLHEIKDLSKGLKISRHEYNEQEQELILTTDKGILTFRK